MQVSIRLPDGNWTQGQRVDVRVVRYRSSYDLCVPLSALRSDSSGYYLLAVERRSTALGIENIVIKVPVTVIAADSDTAAVSGSVGRDALIITGSNKSVTAGDRVRMG